MGISVLPGQPMEPTPWLDQEIPAQQIKEWYYLRSLSLQQSINGTLQLESKTHHTLPIPISMELGNMGY